MKKCSKKLVKRVRNLEEIFEKGRNFIRTIKSKEKILIIFHQDVDGLCSATIALSALKELGLKANVVSSDIENIKKILKKKENYDKIFLLDLPISRIEREIENLGKKIFVIDHHQLPKLKTEKFFYINPRVFDEKIYQPASYIVYKFFSGLVNLKNKEWVAVLGTIGDYGFEDCKDLLSKWIRVKRKENIWKTTFGKAAMLLYNSAIEIGFETVLRILAKTKNVEELIKNKKINSAGKKLEKYLEQRLKEALKNSERFDEANLIFCVVRKIKKRVGSIIVSELAKKYPDKLVFLLTKKGKFYKIHARGGKINLGGLLEKLNVGGGHERAAGGMIKEKELLNFKKRILKELCCKKRKNNSYF
jgi:single-stranded DNA-specific DHH superfamily exonuclease